MSVTGGVPGPGSGTGRVLGPGGGSQVQVQVGGSQVQVIPGPGVGERGWGPRSRSGGAQSQIWGGVPDSDPGGYLVSGPAGVPSLSKGKIF